MLKQVSKFDYFSSYLARQSLAELNQNKYKLRYDKCTVEYFVVKLL